MRARAERMTALGETIAADSGSTLEEAKRLLNEELSQGPWRQVK
jgi:hypothetical protein